MSPCLASSRDGPGSTDSHLEIWGNFIIKDDPSIPNEVANGASSASPQAPNPASRWPVWTDVNPMHINLNQSGGVPYKVVSVTGTPVTQFAMPGLHNNITAANAYLWEGGRGKRCDIWKEVDRFVPQ